MTSDRAVSTHLQFGRLQSVLHLLHLLLQLRHLFVHLLDCPVHDLPHVETESDSATVISQTVVASVSLTRLSLDCVTSLRRQSGDSLNTVAT